MLAAIAACGSSTAAPEKPVEPASSRPPRDESAQRERVRRQELASAHHKLEEEQQDALATSCEDKKPANKHARCLPSCYATELADPRAGKKLPKRAEIPHLVCEASPSSYVVADEIGFATLAVKPARGRHKPHKKGSWQAAVEAALPHGKRDTVVVAGTWRPMTHPITKEKLRCVRVSLFPAAAKLDACGGDGTLGCEAIGDAAARGINVVHYRLAEARQLQNAGKQDECQQAALEAVAVARGLPRWRQYAKLNVDTWVARSAYRTRFDGILDEDALFETATGLGKQAEEVFVACGGAAGAATTADQEQSFHACW